jgi:hypothetical protein
MKSALDGNFRNKKLSNPHQKTIFCEFSELLLTELKWSIEFNLEDLFKIMHLQYHATKM